MLRALILAGLLAASARAGCPTSGGDPITSFDGVSTRYWLKNGTDVALLGTAGPTPGYNKSVVASTRDSARPPV